MLIDLSIKSLFFLVSLCDLFSPSSSKRDVKNVFLCSNGVECTILTSLPFYLH